MVYYYQIRNHHYKTESVPLATCPLCGTRGQMHMSILQKYTWMIGPMAPSSKYAIAWCMACDKYIPRVKWTDEMDGEYVHLKQGLKTPSRLFRGLWVLPLVIAALVGAIMLFVSMRSGKQESNQAFVQAAVMQPKAGDIFQVNHSQGQETHFSYFRVSKVANDSVYVQEARQPAEDMEAWDKIPTDNAEYTSNLKSFSLADIKSLDGMFRADKEGAPAYWLVFGVWRDGELHKKY